MKVLSVCHGNINRSPALEVILRSCYRIQCVSRGFVNPGRRMAAKMRRQISKIDCVDPSLCEEHRSQLIDPQDIIDADVVMYMDNGNLRRLHAMCPAGHEHKLLCLGQQLGHKRIPDPGFMAKDSKEFADTVKMICACSRQLGIAVNNNPEIIMNEINKGLCREEKEAGQ